MKKSLAFLGMLALSSSVANAETFTVTVDVDVALGDIPLTLSQTQAMIIPQIKIDEATVQGADCHAGSNGSGYDGYGATNRNSLCPNLTGQNATFDFSGVPNALVSVVQSTPDQLKNGILFTGTTNTFSHRLDGTTGVGTTHMNGKVELADKSALVDGEQLVFSYDMSVSYQ